MEYLDILLLDALIVLIDILKVRYYDNFAFTMRVQV